MLLARGTVSLALLAASKMPGCIVAHRAAALWMGCVVAVLLIGQFLVYGLAWAVGALMWRDERQPIAWWGAYCVLQAAGLALLRAQGVLTPLSAMLMLLAYTAADVGIDRFVHGHVRWRAAWLGVWGLAAAVQALGWLAGWPLAFHAVAYNLGVAALLLAPILGMQRLLRREFGVWGLLPLLPGALVCGLALVRSAMIVAHPALLAQAPAPLADNPGLLLATLFAAGAFNISFLAMVVARLVMRLHSRLDLDALTGLFNRGGLEKQLAAAFATCRRHELALSVAFIDIDGFKQVNDVGGHLAGDRVICAVADAMRLDARPADVTGRWGGDEFMVIMPHTATAAAVQAMLRLSERVSKAQIEVPAGCPALTLSIGIASLQADDQAAQDLVRRADHDMYLRKGKPALRRVI
jgi:diguanylate cyclase (GGDEF)-like protein